MLITRRSMMTGTIRTLDLPVTEEQVRDWESGGLIQHVMPNLSAAQREFIITGSTEEEWDKAFENEESSYLP